jgi:hypothetical protein
VPLVSPDLMAATRASYDAVAGAYAKAVSSSGR